MEHARAPVELQLEGGPAVRADAWRKWQKQFQIFLKASGVHREPSDVQASLLINLIGSDGYDIYTTFKYNKDEKVDDITTLIKKFDAHFGTKQNLTMCRFKFFTRHQENSETIDDYVTALKLLSRDCEFEHLEEGLIRDRIVCGVSDPTVRDRLLRAEDLTLMRAVNICQAKEMSHEENTQIERVKTDAENGAAAVDMVYGSRGGWWRAPVAGSRGRSRGARGRGAISSGERGTERMQKCISCASEYCDSGVRCPARRAKCFVCGNRGHFKRACSQQNIRQVYQLDEHGSDDERYQISALNSEHGNKDKKWYVTFKICQNSVNAMFKIDTGSDINVISLDTLYSFGYNASAITQTNIKAQSFCGNFLSVMGTCNIDLVYKNNKFTINFVITKQSCQSVVGKYTCETLSLVKRVYALDLTLYNDLFEGLGKLPGQYKIIIDKNVMPSICPVRKIPVGLKDKLLTELERMEQLGVIRKVTHPTQWVNGVVVVAKKDGSIRVCLDPRPLNRAVRRSHYPLPTITDIATKLQGTCYFSKLDARSGFWMIQIDKESADLCTFGTPYGRYQFLRLPYGVNCASEVFHSKVRQLLEDLEGVDSFVDDVIVWGSTVEQHDERLEKLMVRARQVGIKFNREKCEFCMEKISYLGHTFSAAGMEPDQRKIKAIIEMETPKDRAALQRFLGMINYLSKFIPDYSETVAPLRSLMKQDAEWCWDATHDSTVQILKERVSSAPVLALYAANEPVLLSVDASSRALGAVLLQNGRPVEYASCTLTDTQVRYAQIEKEMLAIVFALERFHQFVYGRSGITVETDHKPLEALFAKSLDGVPARIQRMMLRIQGYDFEVKYTPGKYMFVADALSRAASSDKMTDEVTEEITEQSCFLIKHVGFSDSKLEEVRRATEGDKECQIIIKYIENGWPNSKHEADACVRQQWSYKEAFEYVEGVLFKDQLVYMPRELRAEMVSKVHDGHLGIDRCKRHAREVMFWPGMSRDVESCVRRCDTCRMRAARPSKEPMIAHTIPFLPWHKVGSDIFEIGKTYYLILCDYFSGFVEVCHLPNIGTEQVVKAMKEQFARHGIPAELVTDNGPAYSSKKFRDFGKEWGFKHVTTSPNYPQANGRSEAAVKVIKNILLKSKESHTDFYLGLLNYRATPRGELAAPSQLLMGRRLRTRLPAHTEKLLPERDNTHDYAIMEENKKKSKMYYDEHARNLPELSPNQRVVVVDGERRRLMRVESQAPQPRSYFVTDPAGRKYRRNRRHLIQVNQMQTPDTAIGSAISPVAAESWYNAHSDSEDEYDSDAVMEDGDMRERRRAAHNARRKIAEMFKK